MIEKVIVYYLHQEKTTFAKIVVVISGKLPFTVDFKMKQRVPYNAVFFWSPAAQQYLLALNLRDCCILISDDETERNGTALDRL